MEKFLVSKECTNENYVFSRLVFRNFFERACFSISRWGRNMTAPPPPPPAGARFSAPKPAPTAVPAKYDLLASAVGKRRTPHSRVLERRELNLLLCWGVREGKRGPSCSPITVPVRSHHGRACVLYSSSLSVAVTFLSLSLLSLNSPAGRRGGTHSADRRHAR
jgi:hypothetical protein